MTEQSIFLTALDLEVAERSAYLNTACAGNDNLRREVEQLLIAHERSGTFLNVPAVAQIAAQTPPAQQNTVTAVPSDDAERTVISPEVAPPDELLAFLKPPTRTNSIGRLDHYEIIERIGSGGFGTVLKAFDDRLHRVVAIKMLAPQLAVSGTARGRFIREARSAAAVRNDHVVGIHAIDEGKSPYLVMEYIAGQTLQQKLDATGPLDVKAILRIAQQIATGLAAAHHIGLVHRDIKPANVLLENGVERVKITDFGLARAADDASISQSGIVAGTPTYMAPEQAQGNQIDHRSDLFSLGSVMYALCTGRPPFRASTTMAVLKRVVEDDPRPIREINPEIPEWLSDVVNKLHAKDPAERFQSAKEVADLLATYLTQLQMGGVVTPIGRAEPRKPSNVDAIGRRSPWLSRNWKWATATAMLVIVGALAARSQTVHNQVYALLGYGTVIVELPDPEMTVVATGNGDIREGKGYHRFRLKGGKQQFSAWNKNGERSKTWSVDVTPGMYQIVTVELTDLVPRISADADGWVQLFNGKNLTGWEINTGLQDGWRVEDGAIVSAGKSSYLSTHRRDYCNFHLRAQVKINAGGVSGIFFRGPLGVPDGLFEAQIKNGVATNGTGSIFHDKRKLQHSAPHFEIPPEEWFNFEIIAQEAHIETRVNGRLAVVVEDPLRIGGPIVLDGFSANTVAHFRKIEIKELPQLQKPPSPPAAKWLSLFNGKDLTGWEGAGAAESWLVDNGLLVGRWNTELLRTRRSDFANFHLRAEVQYDGQEFGALFFRAHSDQDDGVIGYSTDLMAYPGGLKESSKDRVTKMKELGERPHIGPREWFTLEVIAEGDRLRIKVNDQLLTDERNTKFGQGFIGFQCTGGGQIRFRKIEVRELPPTTRTIPRTSVDVLPFLAGTWRIERQSIEPIPAAGTPNDVAIAKYDFVSDGKFLRGTGGFGFHFVYQFDPEKNLLRHWQAWTDGKTYGPVVAVFNPDGPSAVWTHRLTNPSMDVESVHQFNFVDPNTIQTRLFHRDVNNKVIREARITYTRVGDTTPTPQFPIDPQRPAEMKVLDRFMGEWRNEMSVVNPATPNKSTVVAAKIARRPILGGRMVEAIKTNESDGAQQYWLNWYDAATQRFRTWHFGNDGIAIEFTGEWDDVKQSMTWKTVDRTIERRQIVRSDDYYESPVTFRDAKGNVLTESTGGSRRITAAKAHEAPRRAADVLPFLVGNWKIDGLKVDSKLQPDKSLIDGHLACDFVADGKFLRLRGWLGQGKDEPIILFSIDPGNNALRHWQVWSSGWTTGSATALFDADNRTLMWTHRFGGTDSVHQYYFVDADTFTHRYFEKDASGKITREQKTKLTRAQGPVTFPTQPADPKRPDEMRVLERYVGEWRNELTVTNFAKPDEQSVQTARAKAQMVLAGRYIEVTETFEPNNASDYTLYWFDAVAKRYRQRLFSSRGDFNEFTGIWDAGAKTMTWKSADGRLERRHVFESDVRHEFKHLAKAPDGKVLSEANGESRRVVGPDILPLRDLVEAKKRSRDTANIRVAAGIASQIDLAKAEAELAEARSRLAEAENDKSGQTESLRELVNWRQEERTLIELRVKVGSDSQDLLDQADGRLADAKARLAKIQPTATSPKKMTPEFGPMPRELKQ